MTTYNVNIQQMLLLNFRRCRVVHIANFPFGIIFEDKMEEFER